MTIDEMEAAFERYSDEYIMFARIEKPKHPRPDLCAFLMLHELIPESSDMVIGARRDEIFIGVSSDALAAVATDEIVRDLTRCGVRFDRDNDCFYMFV